MDTSIFTVAGPIMIGPSSSHTAGAAKMGRIARQIINKEFNRVDFYLYGSFEKTGKGHGTDRALLAGTMGIYPWDERLSNAFEIAKKEGIEYHFGVAELENAHENSAVIKFYNNNELLGTVQGASIGGGEILITNIDGYDVNISGNLNTIFVRQQDKKGVIGHVSSVLAEANINIATMNVSRSAKRENAICIIEVDDKITEEIAIKLADFQVIESVKIIDVN
ncbi:MAG: L-serine ammonia-lyase, iron-sulfur-dependent subunit beta [Anaerovoracaceae bacterium]